MSLVNNTQNHKLDLILAKLEALVDSAANSKKGPKSKNKQTKYTREETSYNSIHIFPFDKSDKVVKIGLLVKNEDAAPIIEVNMNAFLELCKSVKESKSKKTLQFFDYTPTDDIAMLADGEWIM